MFENSNKEAVREIARESMKAHKLRNLTAILGITLTTLLITMVCTVGISFYDTINRGTDITPGPLADGEIKAELEKYEKIRDMPQVEWAAYVIYCNIGSLHNREMSGIKTALLAPQREYYERNKVALLEGRLPESVDEIAVSDTMAERLGGKGNVGDTLVLHPVIWEDRQQVEKEIPVTITGIVTSPIKGLAHTYEEIYTSEAFPEKYAPQMLQEPAGIYVKFIPGEIKDTIPGELYDIAGEVGAAGVQYRMDNGFTVLYLLVVLVFVLMIMFCGYLLIYNIFYISVVNDIRFFGMLKTIGTTGRQIRSLLNWQVARLTCVGITAGLILGYLVGLFIAPVVMAETNYKDFYRNSANPMFFISAVVFSLLTVYISARKAYRLAMRISPIEAARYREKRAGRKKLWAGVSFALSGIIFLVAFTLPMGYNVENMVKRYHTADVRIRQDAMIWGSDEPYQPVSHDMLSQLAELPFIKDLVLYYQARDWEVNEFGGCDAGYGQMKMTEEFREEFIRCEKLGTGWMSERENGDIRLSIRGFPADKLHLEEENIHVIEGSLDEEKFADGGYVIYNQGTNQSNSEAGLIHAGQVLHFSIYDPDRGQYVDKEAEVLAVVERSNPFPTGLLASTALAFPDKVFQEIYSGYQNMVGIVQADAIKELTKEEYAQVEKAVQDSFNYQLSIESKVMRREAERSEKSSMIVIGLFLSGVFGMIGICNVVNTLVTSVLSRKIEFAAMQSVGMTKKQMRAMLCREGLLLSGLSALAAIPLGAFFCYMLGKAILFVSGFSAKIFAAGCVLLLVVMCLVSVLVAVLLTRFLTRKPVVERLREVE